MMGRLVLVRSPLLHIKLSPDRTMPENSLEIRVGTQDMVLNRVKEGIDVWQTRDDLFVLYIRSANNG